MRIAVSGTHCSGKTTLIEEFLGAHPDFAFEPEPYTVLVEDYGEEFASEPSVDDFFRQLEFNVGRLRHYQPEDRVIYERSPVDYLAYTLALGDLKLGDGHSLVETMREIVIDAIHNLELIVFLPLNRADGIEAPDSENPRLRRAVNSRLVSLFEDDEFEIFSHGRIRILEAKGTIGERLRLVEGAMDIAG